MANAPILEERSDRSSSDPPPASASSVLSEKTSGATKAAPDAASALAELRAAARKAKRAPSIEQRMAHLRALEHVLIKNQDAIAEAISKDFSHRAKQETRMSEIMMPVSLSRHTREHLAEWMSVQDRDAHIMTMTGRCELRPQPLGVIGIISPWNYPVQLAFAPLVQALAAGNRVMLKPSEFTPATSELIKRMISDTFAADHVRVITGDSEVGQAFAKLPFDHLVFTGSTAVGKLVMKAAAENLVPVTLELGGKSPAIVGAKFSVERAAAAIMHGKVFNAGQTCVAPDYALVPKGSVDAFVAACKGAVSKMFTTLEKNPDYTAIVNERHLGRLKGYLEDAKSKGAEVVELNVGDEMERKMAPTLVLKPTDEMRLMEDEIFGPILPIVPYDTLDDAIAYVNDRPRPLALYLFEDDAEAVDQVLEETISGGVTVNDFGMHVVQDTLPFGGVGASGMGHYHGREGFEAFSKMKPVFHQSRFNGGAIVRPPFGKAVDLTLRFLIGK